MSDYTDGVITTHDYKTCKEVVNIIGVRGGDGGIILRSATVLSKSLNHIKRFGDKVIYKIIKPIAETLGYILLKFPALKNVSSAFKNTKLIIASALALTVMRVVARFDYWALIICGALPNTDIGNEAVIAGIRHMRMGISHIGICMPHAEQIINFITNEKIDVERKRDDLVDLFTMYEFLSEGYPFKNLYFVCIIHILITLFISNSLFFRLAMKILYRMLQNGQISLATYREIISQLFVAGIPTVAVEMA